MCQKQSRLYSGTYWSVTVLKKKKGKKAETIETSNVKKKARDRGKHF